MTPIVIHPLQTSHLNEFSELYCMCFAEPPWFEYFEPKKVRAEFECMRTWEDIVILEARSGSSLVAGAIGFPAARSHGILDVIDGKYADSYYFAELFVSQPFRRRGIAKKLVHERLELAKQKGYRSIIIRTSVNQTVIQHIYLSRGFRPIGHQDVVSLKRINGKDVHIPDKRVILHKSL